VTKGRCSHAAHSTGPKIIIVVLMVSPIPYLAGKIKLCGYSAPLKAVQLSSQQVLAWPPV
jgi:hypothetical protein